MEVSIGALIIGLACLAFAGYNSKIFANVTGNQLFALLVGLVGATVYWFYLMLLTMETIEVGWLQVTGLGLAYLVSFMSWARFVLTTKGFVGKK